MKQVIKTASIAALVFTATSTLAVAAEKQQHLQPAETITQPIFSENPIYRGNDGRPCPGYPIC